MYVYVTHITDLYVICITYNLIWALAITFVFSQHNFLDSHINSSKYQYCFPLFCCQVVFHCLDVCIPYLLNHSPVERQQVCLYIFILFFKTFFLEQFLVNKYWETFKDFPYTLCPYTGITSLIINIALQSSIFVTIDEPTMATPNLQITLVFTVGGVHTMGLENYVIPCIHDYSNIFSLT